MIKKFLLLLTFSCAALLHSRLAQSDLPLSSDGYYIESAEVRRTNFSFVFHPMKDKKELVESYNKIYFGNDSPTSSTLKGFYVWDGKNNTCHIYIINPITLYEPEYLGHELTHCLFGHFHNDQTEVSTRKYRDLELGIPLIIEPLSPEYKP
jgi:hypothetical protein